MIWIIIGISILIYIILLLISLTFSCGGWEKGCGLCWVGIVQLPLILIDEIITKVRK